jgi:hypothetical protein
MAEQHLRNMAAFKLNIPREALPDLKAIAELDEHLFKTLISAIRETDPTLTQAQMSNQIREKVKLSTADISGVLGTAFVLFNLKEKARGGNALRDQDLVDGIINSETVATSTEFSEVKKANLRDRLGQLVLLEKPLGITSKAFDVMTEHDRIYCGARILSDIRPVFSTNVDAAAGAVIVHTLQIGFHQMGKHQEFYVALDTNDIQTLKSVIERAEKKTVALEAILKKSDVPYLKV